MKSDLYRERLQRDPENPLFCFSLGQALFEEEAYEEAAGYLLKCAQSRADWMMPRILAGKALVYLNKSAEAKSILQEALELAIEQQHDDPAAEMRELLREMA